MLTFTSDPHEYRWNDAKVPSVSDVIAPLEDFAGIPPAVLDNAAARGKEVHEACAAIDNGQEYAYTEESLPYIEAYKRFLAETGFVPTLIEAPMYHELHGYAGTIDRLGTFPFSLRAPHRSRDKRVRNREVLLDIKTAGIVSPAASIQLVGYEQLVATNYGYRAMPRKVLHLRPDGTYKLIDCTETGDWGIFLSLLYVYKWKQRHGVPA